MNTLPLVLYIAAGSAYAVHFVRHGPLAGRVATLTLIAAALAHTFVIGMQTVEVGQVPFVSTTGAISAFVLVLSLSYLYTEMATDERAMGVFIVPLLVALQVIPSFGNPVLERPPVLDSPWFALHVSSLLFAYASFALAFVISITYVLLFKEIKSKQLGFFYARLPSLHILDVMNGRAVTVGWVFLTIGVAVGGVWLSLVQAQSADPRVQAMSLFDPKIFVVLLCWLIYSFEIYARRAIGWSGRRAAWLSTIGFTIVLLNLVPIGYFLTESHKF